MNNQEGKTKKGVGMTVLNVVGQMGPIIGARLYPDTDKPYFIRGMVTCAVAMAVVGLLAGVLRWVLIRENAKRAAEARGDEGGLLARGAGEETTRFVLML